MSRNLKYFNDNHIVYRRDPITDKPDQENEVYMFYLNGTYECYHLFTSKAKITIAKIAKTLKCTTRTIHRNMCTDLKREKELLNKQL